MDQILMDHISIKTVEQRHKITSDLGKYECDPKLQMWSKTLTDVAKNVSCPTVTLVRNP